MAQEEKLRNNQQQTAMMQSFRKLTILLGKLGIGEKYFVINHDENNVWLASQGIAIPQGRPPWKHGKEYGLSLSECRDWVKKYLERQ